MEPILLEDKELEARFDVLSEEILLQILSPNTDIVIASVARKYMLSESQKDILSIIVTMVFYGEIAVEDFESEVIEDIDLPEKVLIDVAHEISKALFAPIVDELHEAYSLFPHDDDAEVKEGDGEESSPVLLSPSIIATTPLSSPAPIILQKASDQISPQATPTPAESSIFQVPTLESEKLLSKENVLDEIEHPSHSNLIPKAQTSNDPSKPSVKVAPYAGNDPYREIPEAPLYELE